MRYLLVVLATFILCASVQAQTMKALSYNTTNGEVSVATNATFTNGVAFTTNAAAVTRTNLGLGATNTLTISNVDIEAFGGAAQASGFVGRSSAGLLTLYGTNVSTATPAFYGWSGAANTAFSAATARTNIGLPLPALSNTSNVTMMRALAGSTNTNQPFSGSFNFTNPDNNASYTAVVSNGIILEVYEY